MKWLLLIAACLILGIWWWRKNYVPSPLEVHYSDLEARQQIGNMAQLAAYVTQPVAAMLGTGWGTTARVSLTNPMYNRPGKTRFNVRFAQPSNNGSGVPGGPTA
jgi:hypothetical protein